MIKFTRGGALSIWDNYYQIETINSKGKLVLTKTNKKSIYYAEHTSKRITRNISKTGTISLEGNTLNIMHVIGVDTHVKLG